jgi:nickel-dependent lactate racemase
MPIAIDYGRQRLELEAASGRQLTLLHGPAGLADLSGVTRNSLNAPLQFPALRRALTPDDQIALVVDEQLPDLAALLVPVLEHIHGAGVEPEAVTLVCPTSTRDNRWIDQLPEDFDGVQVEIHDAKDRRKLSYLATTASGRRLYLNRTLIDADQVVVLSGRRYDPYLGYGGAEGALFPALADEATREEALRAPHDDVPGGADWPLRREAVEVSWLLGQPFYVQVVAAAGDGVSAVMSGAGDACREGERLLDAAWRRTVARRADTVVASLSGDPARHTFADQAAALAAAARVVTPGGRIILLTDAPPVLGPGAEVLRAAADPQAALAALEKDPVADVAALRWARAAAHARLSLLSTLPDETAEDLFASPLAGPAQVQRLVASARDGLLLQDAHRMMVVLG